MSRSEILKEYLPVATLLLTIMPGSASLFASGNILIPNDSNSRITVENAVVEGDETTLFFLTWPERGDPNAGKPCPLNYYSVKLKPGIPSARADVVAKGVCGGLVQESRLLDNHEALIMVRDRLEHWKGGKQLSSRSFSAIDGVGNLGISTDMAGGQLYDIAANGNVVLLVQSLPMIMTALKPDGSHRWEVRFEDASAGTVVKRVLASPDGSALLVVDSLASGLSPSAESQLHFISTSGARNVISLNKTEAAMDFDNLQNMSPADMQKFLAQQGQSQAESISKLQAVAGGNGGFDVLFRREGGGKDREGYFLYRIGPDGNLAARIPLGQQIELHGLERWFDFRVEGDQLILLSSVLVTQQGVNSRRKKWPQNAVSWIDLKNGTPVTRLIPLDTRYLEAAMNAGDEGVQYLDGLPGGDPVLLSQLGGAPLVVAVGSISRRQVLRLHEANDQLNSYTETYDEKQQEIASEAARKQRRIERNAGKQQMNADMAAAVGMSPEAYAALSNREKKEAMVRKGDMTAMMAAAMKQAESYQRSMIAGGNLSPEQAAQMQAAMAQAQQMMGGDSHGMPAGPKTMTDAGSPTQTKAAPEKPKPAPVLKVDSLNRGHIQFTNPDGKLTTLLVSNRQSGKELLRKEYADGVINEYISLGRYKLPLDQLRIIIRNVSGEILEDVTPAITR